MRAWGAVAAVAMLLVALPAGATAQSREAQTSIVNGTTAPISSFPWLAAIKYRGKRLAVSCTGTVVAPRVILTAAHCLYREGGGVRKAANFEVFTGTADLAQATPGNVSLVSRALVFPAYDPGRNLNDAGLLILSAPVSAPPLAIATPGDSSLLAQGTSLTIAGWGLTDPHSTQAPTAFRQTTTTVQDGSYCKRHERRFLARFSPDSQLCTVSTPPVEAGSCQGDSGGPGVAARPDGSLVEVGIISEGAANCDPTEPEVLARVDHVSEWVGQWIAAVESGGPAPPVEVPKVVLPRLSIPEAKLVAVVALAGDFGRRFTRGRLFEFFDCSRINRSKVKCGVVWVRGGDDYYGTITVFWAFDEDGAYPSYHYRIHWVNDRCWFHSGHRRSCVIHSRGG